MTPPPARIGLMINRKTAPDFIFFIGHIHTIALLVKYSEVQKFLVNGIKNSMICFVYSTSIRNVLTK